MFSRKLLPYIFTPLLFVMFGFLLLTPLAFADAQLVPCGPNNPSEAALKAGNVSGCTLQDIMRMLFNIYQFLLGMAAFVAMLFIIWGGIQMFSPSAETVEGGKKTLTYAITGLVIILTSYLIINTMIVVMSGADSINLDSIINPFTQSIPPDGPIIAQPPPDMGGLPIVGDSADNLFTNLSPEEAAAILAQAYAGYNKTSYESGYQGRFDLNQNGHIDSSDIAVLESSYLGIARQQPAPAVLGLTASAHANVNWQNPDNPLDVNADGSIGPMDFMIIINFLNENGETDVSSLSETPPPYYDVDGDGIITSRDAQLVLNELNKDSPTNRQNPDNRFDVNADGVVTPMDALIIINYVNQHGETDVSSLSGSGPPYYDVDGDGRVTQADAQAVLDEINRGGGSATEVPATNWQNPENRFDVNADGKVSPLDAMIIANFINEQGEKNIRDMEGGPPYYYDVNGDGRITQADAQAVLDELERRAIADPSGRSTSLWQNPDNRFDVNGDGEVSPLDFFIVNTFLSQHGEFSTDNLGGAPPPYYDVNGDGRVTQADALAVLDELNKMSSSSTWQNPDNRFDVNGDGSISPSDYLLIMHYLDRNGETNVNVLGGSPPPYYDVDGDGRVTQADAQAVLDELNRVNTTNPLKVLDTNNDGRLTLDEIQPRFESLVAAVGSRWGEAGYVEEFDLYGDGRITSRDVAVFVNTALAFR